MPDLVKMLRDLADAYEKEARLEAEGESTKKVEARIDELEKLVRRAPADDVEEAVEEISDEEWEMIRAHRSSSEPKPKPERKPKPVEEEKPRRTRPGRRSGSAYDWTVDDTGNVQRTDIAHIYNGEDEPDEVELPDEETEAA